MIGNITDYLAAYGATASHYTGNISATSSRLEITGGLNGSIYDIADSTDISNTARDMLDRIKNLDVFSCIYPNNDAGKKTKSLGEVKDDFMADFYDFSSYFSQLSSMTGLSGSDTYVMGLNGIGGMTVTGTDSASANKLAAGFSGNETLTARFAVMAARAALTDASSTVSGFKDSYNQDPVAAIQDNIDALKERLLGFRTVAGNGTMQYGFMREEEMEIDFSGVAVEFGQTA